MPLLRNRLRNQYRSSLAILLALSVPACQRGYSQPIRPTPLPQDPLIQVYINHEPASSYTEPYRKQTRDGDDLEQVIVDTIATARSTVDVAVQELRLPKVASALVARQATGVKVRVILENTYAQPFSALTADAVAKLPERDRGHYDEFRQLIDQNGDGQLSPEESNQRDALVMLDRAQIPRLDDTADGSAGSSLMHDKFLIVDGRTVIVTSANFTTSDVHGDFKSPASRGNANNLLRIDSPELATLFSQEFNLMWGDGPGGKRDSKFGVKKPLRSAQSVMVGSTQVDVQFSPTSPTVPWNRSSNGLIGKTLSAATRSVDLALFVFSDQKLVNLLDPVHQKGADVRALIEPEFAYRPYSEALNMLGLSLADGCRYESDDRPWQMPIATVGVPRLPPGDLLHHKFGIVDQQIVVTGSHNWTDAANNGNDETVLVVHSPIVAAHYQREFERLYTDAILGIPPAIQKKVDAQKQECPSRAAQPARSRAAEQPDREPVATTNKSAAKRPHPANHPQPAKPSSRGLVNLNTATEADLEALPGVGPGLAKRIIASRQQHPLTSLQDLDRIPGVGPKLLKRLEPHITF